jgi:DNA-binding NarL/FixJ family response regulator
LAKAGFQVVAEAEDGRTAVRLAKKLKPDVVVTDIGIPCLNGIECTRRIRQESPRSKVVVLSMHAEGRLVLEAFAAGASGYLVKDAAFEEMIVALKAVLKGQKYLSPAVADGVVVRSLRQWSSETKPADPRISSREREVLQLVAEGRSTKQIAASLFVSVKTVETHRKQIMGRLNIHSIAGLTKYAVREGITAVN